MGGAAASLPADAEAGVPPARAQRHSQVTLVPPKGPKVRIVYMNKGKGTWSLEYHDGKIHKSALSIQCADTGRWMDVNVAVPGDCFDGRLPGGADLALKHVAGDDVIFHMVEVMRE